MTNTAEMTNTDLQAELAEAVEWSNRYFEDRNWFLAEQWHLKAVELVEQLQLRSLEPRGA